MKMLVSLVSVMMIALMFAGCAGPEKGEVTGGMSEYPDWVSTENNTYNDDGSAVIFCVGTAAAGRNPAMRWDSAKNNAIINISRILNTHVRAMFTTYAREAGDFYDEDTLSSIRNDEQVGRSLTESFISGAISVNRFLTEDKKEAYVLMRLDLDNKMLQMMSDRAKKAVRENFAAKVKEQTDEALSRMDAASKDLKSELMGSPAAPAAAIKK